MAIQLDVEVSEEDYKLLLEIAVDQFRNPDDQASYMLKMLLANRRDDQKREELQAGQMVDAPTSHPPMARIR